VQKFGNDQAGAKAALVAYYGLFAIFPLLLLLSTILGFVLSGHPALQQDVINSALGDFPIIGTQLKSVSHPLRGNGFALVVGIAGTIYGAQGVGEAAQNAMNSVWNVPFREWPGLVPRHLRAMAILFVLGIATLASTFLANAAGLVLHGRYALFGAWLGSVVVNLGVFFAAFMLLTGESLTWRDVAPGVVLATIFWQILQALGGFYVRHALNKASDVYGFFALVIGLLSFLYLAAELTLLAAEINVVHRYRLWPRSITQPPFTDGDKATFERLAVHEERRPEMKVIVHFTPEADHDPLEDPEAR
jgi:YihY family inner membrane protein